MKSKLLKLSACVILIAAACSALFGGTGSSSLPVAAPENDSIYVTGKFAASCTGQNKVRIWKYNAMDYNINSVTIPANANGEFTFATTISGPQEICIKADYAGIDIMATPKEKIYHIEISCDNGNRKRVEIKNSSENRAYVEFCALTKSLKDTLDRLSKTNLEQEDTFRIVRNIFTVYEEKIASIAKNNPATYTAQALCPAVTLPKNALASAKSLRESYLPLNSLANPQFYQNDLFPSYMAPDYFFIHGKKDPPFVGFDKALNASSSNPEATRTLEQILYYIFLAQRKEQLFVDYINWAKAHTDKMFNLVVKAQLNNLSTCIAGAPYIDITLNDQKGNPRKLSEAVSTGKLTLLIFYSPTCSHCQETLPKITLLWNLYKSKGFKVYAVADNSTPEQWDDFIKNKSTNEWINVFEKQSGMRENSKYALNSIPTLILIDGQGKIISRFKTLEELQMDLPKYLGK